MSTVLTSRLLPRLRAPFTFLSPRVLRKQRPSDPRLSLPLKPPRGAHDGNGLVHDEFADGKILCDPSLGGFVVGDLVFSETRPR